VLWGGSGGISWAILACWHPIANIKITRYKRFALIQMAFKKLPVPVLRCFCPFVTI